MPPSELGPALPEAVGVGLVVLLVELVVLLVELVVLLLGVTGLLLGLIQPLRPLDVVVGAVEPGELCSAEPETPEVDELPVPGVDVPVDPLWPQLLDGFAVWFAGSSDAS